MQPMRYIDRWLQQHATSDHCIFSYYNLRPLLPNMTEPAFKTLLSRAVTSGIVIRLCRGLYLYQKALQNDGLLLFHAATIMRQDEFNYISLETCLSDVGIISQVPINWVTIMSSGRSSIISCGEFGTIEFIHTEQTPEEIALNLTYDKSCGMWRANISQALRDMKKTRRNLDLIDWELANELIE